MDNLLNEQKSMIKRTLSSYIMRVVLLAILLPLLFLPFALFPGSQFTTDYTLLLLFVAVIVIAIALVTYFLWDFIICIKAYKALNKIYIITEETKEITCTKINYLTMSNGKSGYCLTGIVLTDTCKRKFYYIFTDEISVTRRNQKSTNSDLKKKLLYNSMQVSCYQGTNVIQELQLDMYEHQEDLLS